MDFLPFISCRDTKSIIGKFKKKQYVEPCTPSSAHASRQLILDNIRRVTNKSIRAKFQRFRFARIESTSFTLALQNGFIHLLILFIVNIKARLALENCFSFKCIFCSEIFSIDLIIQTHVVNYAPLSKANNEKPHFK